MNMKIPEQLIFLKSWTDGNQRNTLQSKVIKQQAIDYQMFQLKSLATFLKILFI